MDLSTRTIILISVFSVIAIGAIAYSGILIRRLKRSSRTDDDKDVDLSMSTVRDTRPRSVRSVQYVITEDPPVPPPAPPRHYPRENLTSVSLSGLSGRKLHHDRHHQWSSRHSVDYAPSQISAPMRRDHTPYRPRRVRSRSVDFDERNRSIESYNVRNRGSFTSAEDGERYSYASYTDDELDDIVDEFLDFSGWQKGRDSRRPRDGDPKKVQFSRARQVNLIHDITSAANEVSDAGQLIGKKVQNMAGDFLRGPRNDDSPSGEASAHSWYGSSHRGMQRQQVPPDPGYYRQPPPVADLEQGIPISTITVPRGTEVEERDNKRKKSSRRAKHVVRLW